MFELFMYSTIMCARTVDIANTNVRLTGDIGGEEDTSERCALEKTQKLKHHRGVGETHGDSEQA